jgi:hypothetical protein
MARRKTLKTFVWISSKNSASGQDGKLGGIKQWASFFSNRLSRILPVHYCITFIILLENPSGSKRHYSDKYSLMS